MGADPLPPQTNEPRAPASGLKERTIASIPAGITVTSITAGSLRVTTKGSEAVALSESDPAVDRAWADLRRANPRLHDGPVWLVDPASLADGELCCRRGTYRHLATASVLNRPIRALGVCGLVIGRDERGEKHILFGRRSSETRIYGGMWENAPSGTVNAHDPTRPLNLRQLVTALAGEGLEELGIDLRTEAVQPIATLEDAHACSVDVVLRVDLREPINPRQLPCPARDHGRWEYVDTAWVPQQQTSAWMRQSSDSISPPTLGLVAHLGLAE